MNLLPLLSRLVALRPPVVVIPHENADIDAVASALGMQRFFRALEKESVLFAPSLSAPAARLLQRVGAEYVTEYDISGKDVVLVDTSPNMEPVDLSPAAHVVGVDHHEGKRPYEVYVYPRKSCSEIVAELLFRSDVYDPDISLVLAAGIYTDTAGLNAADAESLETLSKLLRVADAELADVIELISSRKDISERIAQLRALERGEIHRFGDYLLVVSRVNAFEASAANVLLSAGADVALVYSKKRLSARMKHRFYEEQNVDLLELFSRVSSVVGGSFGGHPLAAGMHTDDPEKAARVFVDVFAEIMGARGYTHRVY